AVIVGDSSTFGKGTVQTLLELGRFMPLLGGSSNDAGALKLTVQKFYRVAGGSTQLRGGISDVPLPSLSDNSEIGEASLEHPLPYDEVEPAAIDLANNRKPLFIDDLRKRSSNRINQDAALQDVTGDMKILKDHLKTNRLSLNEKIRRDELDEDNDRKQKELTDEKKIDSQLQDKRYELTLADLNKPQLKLLPREALPAANKDAKASPTPEDDLIGEESGNTPDADAIRRETLSIMADLI